MPTQAENALELFGPFVHPGLVEDALRAQLTRWMPDYLRAAEVRLGLPAGKLAPPADLDVVGDVDEWDDDHLPAVVIVGDSPAAARVHADAIEGAFPVDVMIVTAGVDRADARRTAQIIGLAVTELLLHKADEHPLITRVVLAEGAYTARLRSRQRDVTRQAHLQPLTVVVDQVLAATGGPDEPLDDAPFAALPVITEVEAVVLEDPPTP